MKTVDVKKAVRENYGKIAKKTSSCCGPVAKSRSSCCGSGAVDASKFAGYSDDELNSIPEDANLGLGCGNPVAIASLKEGETVLDLGSGAGIDCFLAAGKVGEKGRVIGVDMTTEMLERARSNIAKSGFKNVEFRLGEIEHLPVEDNSVDVVISNCVINLSPEKEQVFKEIFRVMKPGGRFMISDIVLKKELPDEIRTSIEAYVGCIAGASLKERYISLIEQAGFSDIKIASETGVPADLWFDDPLADSFVKEQKISRDEIKDSFESVVSIKVQGVKR